MEYKEFKNIVKEMEESNLSELSIEFPDGTKISLKKDNKPVPTMPKTLPHEENTLNAQEENKKEECQEDFKIVKSPMVGTFYEKPSPNADSFVTVGQKVKKGDVLCIIEAMKLMNEIESEFDGEIAEICVKDGEAVDFNKPLFKIICK